MRRGYSGASEAARTRSTASFKNLRRNSRDVSNSASASSASQVREAYFIAVQQGNRHEALAELLQS